MKRTRITRQIVLLGLTFALGSCGNVEQGTQGGIGSEGGMIRSSNGRITLDVPAGALDHRVTISIRELDNGALPSGGVRDTGFELLPEGLTFAKPVTLTLAYQDDALPQADTTWLRIVQILDDGRLAVPDPATGAPAGTVSAQLAHFSKYAVADLKLANATVTTTKTKITAVDVLFVIDNSNSMETKQKRLAQDFPRLIQKLEQAKLDYRVGVISTDLGAGGFSLASCETPGGDGGKLHSKPGQLAPAGCPTPKDAWIESKSGVTNVPGNDVAAAFSCIARLGVGGCGFEQPLESMRRALDPALNLNPGFIRPNAALVVVIITDEDDCSAKDPNLFDPANTALGPLTSFRCTEYGITCDVNGRTPGARQSCVPSTGSYLFDLQRYMDLLTQLKPSGDVILSVIAGPASPVEVALDGANPALKMSCTSADGGGLPAVRLSSLVGSFGKRGALTSVCDSDFGLALDMVGNLVVEQIQVTWCLPWEPTDLKPQTADLDGDCLVWASKAGKLLPCQAGSTTACYKLEKSTTCSSKAIISVENIAPADMGDEVSVACLTN
jgi:hypothetical protein